MAGAPDRELTVGLVGPGAIGRVHAQAIAAASGARLAAICGGEVEAARAIAPGIPWFADARAMLAAARPDIVAIATPGGAHVEPARLALAAGCYVIVEKPLCVDPAEAARLVGLARRSGRVHATVSQRRLEPQHRHLAALLAGGALGRPRFIEAQVNWLRTDTYYAKGPWRATVAHGGGSLMNQGVHSLDLMLWLFGEVNEVTARCGNLAHPAIEVEDTTAALLTFANGAFGVIVTSTSTPPGYPAELRVFTDCGSAIFVQDQVQRWDFPNVAPPPPHPAIASGASDPMAIGIAGHVAQWRDFLAAIRENRPPAITLEDGCMAVRVAAAIYRAAAEGRSVRVSEFPAVLDDEA